MVQVIRHTNCMNRFLIKTRVPYVRFVCDHCDCIFQVNGDDFEFKEMQDFKNKNTYILLVQAVCPDCNRVVRRHFEEVDIYGVSRRYVKESKNDTDQ